MYYYPTVYIMEMDEVSAIAAISVAWQPDVDNFKPPCRKLALFPPPLSPGPGKTLTLKKVR